MFIIVDRNDRRVVLPRTTSGAAIDVIARVFAGERSTMGQRRATWERLRDVDGFRLEQATPTESELRAEIRSSRSKS